MVDVLVLLWSGEPGFPPQAFLLSETSWLAPAANQCAAAHFPEAICVRHFRPIGLRWAVSPGSWHCRRAVHRPARDRGSLAPCWISTVLALAIQTARRETQNPAGGPEVDPGHEPG